MCTHIPKQDNNNATPDRQEKRNVNVFVFLISNCLLIANQRFVLKNSFMSSPSTVNQILYIHFHFESAAANFVVNEST